YGRATWPKAAEHALDHAASAIRPFENHKAWREQVHRHVAAILGLLVLGMALLAARRRRHGIAQVLAASGLVAIAIPTYMAGAHVAASVLAAAGEAILLAAALPCLGRGLGRESALTLALILVQALPRMWTVAWLLKPVVVMAHLLAGLLTFSLFTWMAWRATNRPIVLAY